MSDLRYVGRDIARNDIVQKVSGQMRYLADLRPGGTCHARLLLSPVAHGRVKAIDGAEAAKVPGFIRLFTAEDSPRRRYNSALFLPDQQDLKDQPLFTDRPLFVGDMIGAVLAETDEAARKAAALVRVDVEPLEAVTDPVTALSALSFRDGFPQIVEGRLSCGDGAAPTEGHAELTTTVRTPKIHHAAMENHICRSHLDYDDVLVVQSPCQMIFTVRFVLSDLFDRPINRVRVIKAPMGGTFGGKQEVMIEPACALMTLATGLPVQLNLDRNETINATRTRAASVGTVRTVVDGEGHFLHRETDIVVDAGAYATGGHRVAMAMGKKLFRLYRIPSQTFRTRTTFTNTTPSGACRGYGSPQIHAITEIHIDLLARKLALDPAELRLKNLVEPGDLDPTGAPPLGNARIKDCLLKGMERFRWNERIAAEPGEGRYRRAVGLACATHGNGYFGSPYPDFLSMAIRLCEDGTLLVNAGLHELGNGTLTIVAQIVGEVLGLDPSRIVVTEGDTQTAPFDVGCVASRVTYVCGACAYEAAERLKTLFRDQIAEATGKDAEGIELDGEVRFDDGERLSYGDAVCLIAKALRQEVGIYHNYAPKANPASFGVHFAEVEVDCLTGLSRITDFLAVHDVGKAINPRLLKGQIYGGVQMGLGMALSEELAYDRSGRPKNDRFSRYPLVNAPDMPPVDVLLIEEHEPGGPYGAKSIGEICTVPTAAAIVNAVNRALVTELTELPLTPERIIAALAERESNKTGRGGQEQVMFSRTTGDSH